MLFLAAGGVTMIKIAEFKGTTVDETIFAAGSKFKEVDT
jgi:hypothetical protein